MRYDYSYAGTDKNGRPWSVRGTVRQPSFDLACAQARIDGIAQLIAGKPIEPGGRIEEFIIRLYTDIEI